MMKQLNFNIENLNLNLSLNHYAPQTNASVWLAIKDARALITVVMGEQNPNQDFFPLTVEYKEKAYAAGIFPPNPAKRETRPTDAETLSSRLIDRSIRPLFPDELKRDLIITITLFSADPTVDMPTAALNAVSLALATSDVPWNGPVASLRVARIDGQFYAFPTPEQRQLADMDFVISAANTGIIMVEGGAREVSEDDMLSCLEYAQATLQPALNAIQKYADKHGKTKITVTPEPEPDPILLNDYEQHIHLFRESLKIADKIQRRTALEQSKKTVLDALLASAEQNQIPFQPNFWQKRMEHTIHETARDLILNEQRFDKRSLTTIRPISFEAHPLPSAHGSAFFSRGLTQSLASVTLGGPRDAQKSDDLYNNNDITFFLHYNFPPYSVGEPRSQRAPGRREIGHGMLAQRALEAVIPSYNDFPYTIRVNSEILSSDGSSSMASVCAASLALMDAGVPIKNPVTGIAMGLIYEKDKHAILTDIVGDEDHLGDMDFKVCGTQKGITALQMDLKIGGISKELLKNALLQAREARLYILGVLRSTLDKPKLKLADNAPKVIRTKLKKSIIGEIIGPGGSNLRSLTRQTNTQIDIDDDGMIRIASHNIKDVEAAQRYIEKKNKPLKVGDTIAASVLRAQPPFLKIECLGTETSIHFNDINPKGQLIEDLYQPGDTIMIKITGTDSKGNLLFTNKDL